MTRTVTVADRLEGLNRWQATVDANTADYATPEWKARARATIDGERKHLMGREHDTPLPSIYDVAYGNADSWFSDPEQWAILWQYQKSLSLGSFRPRLIEAAVHADPENLERLAKAYPALVEGITAWRNDGSFAARIKALLVEAD